MIIENKSFKKEKNSEKTDIEYQIPLEAKKYNLI